MDTVATYSVSVREMSVSKRATWLERMETQWSPEDQAVSPWMREMAIMNVLQSPYLPSCTWWECVYLFRRLLNSMCFIMPFNVMQNVALACLSTAFLAHHDRHRPFRSPQVNMVESWLLTSLVFLAGLNLVKQVLQTAAEPSSFTEQLRALMVGADTVQLCFIALPGALMAMFSTMALLLLFGCSSAPRWMRKPAIFIAMLIAAFHSRVLAHVLCCHSCRHLPSWKREKASLYQLTKDLHKAQKPLKSRKGQSRRKKRERRKERALRLKRIRGRQTHIGSLTESLLEGALDDDHKQRGNERVDVDLEYENRSVISGWFWRKYKAAVPIVNAVWDWAMYALTHKEAMDDRRLLAVTEDLKRVALRPYAPSGIWGDMKITLAHVWKNDGLRRRSVLRER